MSHSDGTRTSASKKMDSAAPVSSDFWDQFVRDWGLIKYVGNVYSIFFGIMGIRDLADRLLTYMELSRDTEEQKDVVLSHVNKLKPLIVWFDQWMYDCIEVPEAVNGSIEIRKIGFYHLRRQSVMPVRYEMRAILEGFSEPVANADYSDLRKYALYGEYDEKGVRKGGVKNIANQMEAHFHHIIKVMKVQPTTFEEEDMSIGDEDELESLEELSKNIHEDKIQAEVQRLRDLTLGDED